MQISVKTDRLPQEILLRLLPFGEDQSVFFENGKQLIIKGKVCHKEIMEFLLENAVVYELTAGEGQDIEIRVVNSEENGQITSMATVKEKAPTEKIKKTEDSLAEAKTKVAQIEDVKDSEESLAETKTKVAQIEDVKDSEESLAETETKVAQIEDVKDSEESLTETETKVAKIEEVKNSEEKSTETETKVAKTEEVKDSEESLAEAETKVAQTEDAKATEENPVETKVDEAYKLEGKTTEVETVNFEILKADTFSKKNGEKASKKKVDIDRGTFNVSVFDEFSKGKDKKTFLKNLAEEYLGQKNDERKETFAEGILKVVNTEDVKAFVSTTEWDIALRSNITYHLKKYDVSLKNFVEELVAYIKVKYNISTENSISLKETNKDEISVSYENEAKAESVNELIVKSFDMPKEDFLKLSIDDRVKHIFDKMVKDIAIEKFEKANILSMFQHAMKRRTINNFDCIYLDNIVEGVEQLERNKAEMLCATIIESFCDRMVKVAEFWRILQVEILSNKELEALRR